MSGRNGQDGRDGVLKNIGIGGVIKPRNKIIIID